ncbi:MAG: FeoA domain-containing protein [Anaerolineales bacterium]|nr:FeoA domain-containing protein [Anaerolineales bacterium]
MNSTSPSLSESMQMYIITIARLSTDNQPVPLSKLAEELDISPVSVNEMCRKLQETGLVNYQPYKGASLTPEGLEKACYILRRHDLWEVFLVEKLGFDITEAYEIACHLEHIPSSTLVDRLDAFLDYPNLNPSGVAIPGKGNKNLMDVSVSLDRLNPGQTARVLRCELDERAMAFLNKAGFMPGTDIKILAETEEGMFLHCLGKDVLSLSREFTKNIYVVISDKEKHNVTNKSAEKKFTNNKEISTMGKQQINPAAHTSVQRKILSELKIGQSGIVVKVGGKGQIRQRMMDMGLVPGSEIKVLRKAPLGDPVEFSIKGYNLSLRKSEAKDIEVEVSE